MLPSCQWVSSDIHPLFCDIGLRRKRGHVSLKNGDSILACTLGFTPSTHKTPPAHPNPCLASPLVLLLLPLDLFHRHLMVWHPAATATHWILESFKPAAQSSQQQQTFYNAAVEVMATDQHVHGHKWPIGLGNSWFNDLNPPRNALPPTPSLPPSSAGAERAKRRRSKAALV